MKLDESAIIEFLKNATGNEVEVEVSTALFSTGMLDSVAMMNLIMFLEEQGGIHIRMEDVTLENFDTVSNIVSFIQVQR